MIYVVLGMHKSGTTLVSQMLHRSGINMVDDENASVSYDQGNKYERLSMKNLNDEILSSKDVSSIKVRRPAIFSPPDEARQRAQGIVSRLNGEHVDWGFKDPRTCLTYPFWRKLLGNHKIIVILREPEEIWHNYSSVNPFKSLLRAWRLMESWSQANENILQWLQGVDLPVLVLTYRELMTSPESLDSLSAFVGTTLQDVRKQSLYRGRSKGISVLKLVSVLHRRMTKRDPAEILRQFEIWK